MPPHKKIKAFKKPARFFDLGAGFSFFYNLPASDSICAAGIFIE